MAEKPESPGLFGYASEHGNGKQQQDPTTYTMLPCGNSAWSTKKHEGTEATPVQQNIGSDPNLLS